MIPAVFMNISKACGRRAPRAVCFLSTTLLSVKHQAPFPNFVYGDCIYNSNANQIGFSFVFRETRPAVTYCKDARTFPSMTIMFLSFLIIVVYGHMH